jgi:hypothetical protein
VRSGRHQSSTQTSGQHQTLCQTWTECGALQWRSTASLPPFPASEPPSDGCLKQGADKAVFEISGFVVHAEDDGGD